jgi:hypothetical protein
MPAPLPFQFASPLLVTVSIAVIALVAIIARIRRVALDTSAHLLITTGLLLLAMASAGPRWLHQTPPVIDVYVDLSPSTRGATFRDHAALDRRINQLLGNTPHEIIAFASSTRPLPPDATLPDITTDQTTFTPPTGADAILLFSDGRFDLPPLAPPVYPVIDPALDNPSDAQVAKLEFRDGHVVADIRSDDPHARDLKWTNATAETSDPVTGNIVRRATPASDGEIIAALSPGDRWPENDSLSIHSDPPPQLERWWIGARDPGAGWRHLSPAALPTDPAAYLNVAAIVLDDIATDEFSSEQQDRLLQFTRDLGGGIVIVGGQHAFAAGGYDGTPIDALSPLASSPPTPSRQWIVLVDGSGSMAADAGDGMSRWQTQLTAVARLIPTLPPNDLLRLGSFAESITWWSTGKSARDTSGHATPPADLTPRGPTNLDAAMKQIIGSSTHDEMPTELLVMTDGEAQLADVDALRGAMSAHRLRLHLLAIGNGEAIPVLKSLAAASGGFVLQPSAAGQWVDSARQLVRKALADGVLVDHPTTLTFEGDLAALGQRAASAWNRVWLKQSATRLAHTESDEPIAARWQAGFGRAAAVAYPADVAGVARITDLVAAAPRDPRFTVDWTCSATLDVRIDAIDHGTFLNGESLVLELIDPTAYARPEGIVIPQVAPGQYRVSFPTRRSPLIAQVRDPHGGILPRFAVAGRYPPEFDAIGNDRANLRALADHSGGAVIEPGDASLIPAHGRQREIDLSSMLASGGAALIALGLVRWRRASS